ncbi:MAG: type II toxin-antitoxin system VapC family toxin [Snowella sp.]|nr:type II toxin-antitoxin system VapC family toxin [Snowella sp.]
MKILLDTHIWLWYLFGSSKLSPTLQIEISNPNNELWLSPISIWETLMLTEKGKITLTKSPEAWLQMAFTTLEVTEAPLTNQIAILSRKIELPHQDPADRFIAATALYYDLVLATVDKNLTSAKQILTLS